MDPLGYHFLIELHGCNAEKLNNKVLLEQLMNSAIDISKAIKIGEIFHQFSPHGISGAILIKESHFSIHTWPENSYAAIDLFTCNPKLKITESFIFLCEQLDVESGRLYQINRGLNPSEPLEMLLEDEYPRN